MGDENGVAEERLAALHQARNARATPAAATSAEAATQRLKREIELGQDATAFVIALLIAASKDGLDVALDIVVVGEIPFVGQIPGLLISLALTYFLWKKRWLGQSARLNVRAMYYGLALFGDNLPLINDLPLNVIAVLWAWHRIRNRAAAAAEELATMTRTARNVTAET